jgi:hypothetical protein
MKRRRDMVKQEVSSVANLIIPDKRAVFAINTSRAENARQTATSKIPRIMLLLVVAIGTTADEHLPDARVIKDEIGIPSNPCSAMS